MRLVGVVLLAGLLALPPIGCCSYQGASAPTVDELNRVADSTVKIENFFQGNRSRGSGVIIASSTRHTRVLTAAHVVFPSDSIMVRDLSGIYHKGKRGRFSLVDDWAVVIVDTYLGEPVALHVGPHERYEDIYAVGYALGFDYATATEGRFQSESDGLIRFSAPIVFGNSGGGIFARSSRGLVLSGIVSKIYITYGDSPVYHIGVAVSVDLIGDSSGFSYP